MAGPCTTLPLRSNSEPWQGQRKIFCPPEGGLIWQPRCEQVALSTTSSLPTLTTYPLNPILPA